MSDKRFKEMEFYLKRIKEIYTALNLSNKDLCYNGLLSIRKYKSRLVSEIEKIEDELIDNINEKYYIGKMIVAKEDCMNNFKESQIVEITGIEGEEIILDDAARVHVNFVDRYFD